MLSGWGQEPLTTALAASIDDINITCDNEPSGSGKTLSTLVCFLTLPHLKYAKSSIFKLIQKPIKILNFL